MKIIRKIFWICAKFDIQLFASWIPTDINVVADAASRLDFALVAQLSGINIPWFSVKNFSSSLVPLASSARISPFSSPVFSQLIMTLWTSSLPRQEKSYWPLMQSLPNVLDGLRGKFLFGFAMPMMSPLDNLGRRKQREQRGWGR
jgi:hypothetical protein